MAATRFARSPFPIHWIPLLACAGSIPCEAQLTSANGPEFQVNSYTNLAQYEATAAYFADGRFVIAWTSQTSPIDPDLSSVHLRRHAASGTPLANQFQANTYTGGAQFDPAISIGVTGRFVVTWTSGGSEGSDTAGNSIQARIFDTNGGPLTPQFQVNTYTTGEQVVSDVAWYAPDAFVVVWASSGSASGDSNGTSIQLQRFDESGTALGSEFQVNTYTTGWQYAPSVAAGLEGVFVVAWQSDGGAESDVDSYSIQVRPRFSDGNWGDPVQANTFTTAEQIRPAVAADAQGNFVVAWSSAGSNGTDSSGRSIQARRFQFIANPIGGQFQVNSHTTGEQDFPDVAIDARGNFVVAWESATSPGSDSDAASVQARRYSAAGTPDSVQFQVNTYTTTAQEGPAIASDPLGDFVVAWTGYGSAGTDTDLASIHGQRFDGLFSDGFEGGNTARWSLAQPLGTENHRS